MQVGSYPGTFTANHHQAVCGDADCNMATDLIAIACAVILAAFGALSLLSLFRRVRKFEAEQQIDREHLDVLQKLVKKC